MRVRARLHHIAVPLLCSRIRPLGTSAYIVQYPEWSPGQVIGVGLAVRALAAAATPGTGPRTCGDGPGRDD